MALQPRAGGGRALHLYRQSDEVGQSLTMVGYGLPGTGASGHVTNYSGSPLRLKANNLVDAEAASLKSSLGQAMGWTLTKSSQLTN